MTHAPGPGETFAAASTSSGETHCLLQGDQIEQTICTKTELTEPEDQGKRHCQAFSNVDTQTTSATSFDEAIEPQEPGANEQPSPGPLELTTVERGRLPVPPVTLREEETQKKIDAIDRVFRRHGRPGDLESVQGINSDHRYPVDGSRTFGIQSEATLTSYRASTRICESTVGTAFTEETHTSSPDLDAWPSPHLGRIKSPPSRPRALQDLPKGFYTKGWELHHGSSIRGGDVLSIYDQTSSRLYITAGWCDICSHGRTARGLVVYGIETMSGRGITGLKKEYRLGRIPVVNSSDITQAEKLRGEKLPMIKMVEGSLDDPKSNVNIFLVRIFQLNEDDCIRAKRVGRVDAGALGLDSIACLGEHIKQGYPAQHPYLILSAFELGQRPPRPSTKGEKLPKWKDEKLPKRKDEKLPKWKEPSSCAQHKTSCPRLKLLEGEPQPVLSWRIKARGGKFPETEDVSFLRQFIYNPKSKSLDLPWLHSD